MKSSRITSPGVFTVSEVPDPTPGVNEVLIQPLFISICGSDIYVLHYMPEDTYPKDPGTTGHEMVGIVRGVGADVLEFAAGDLVLGLSPNHTAMSELYCAPADKTLKLPKGRTLEEYLMAQQLGTVIYACDRLPVISGKTALVVGQGSAGLFFNSMLKRLGASSVFATDLEPTRLDLSPSFGADGTFLNRDVDPVTAIKNLNSGKLVDIVVEATGEPGVINMVPNLVEINGLLVMFGVPHQWSFEYDYFSFYRRYATTITNSGSMDADHTSMFSRALEMVADGEVPAASMITHRVPFDHLDNAYELARTRKDGAVKVIVEMPGSEGFRNKVV